MNPLNSLEPWMVATFIVGLVVIFFVTVALAKMLQKPKEKPFLSTRTWEQLAADATFRDSEIGDYDRWQLVSRGFINDGGIWRRRP